jgi:hypothetical protein
MSTNLFLDPWFGGFEPLCGRALALFDLYSGQPQFGENPERENKN